MSLSEIPRVGLLFTSFVELFTAFSALALVIFLFKRWSSSDASMRAYMLFWFVTFFVWAASVTRYILVTFGYENLPIEHLLSIITQVFVFLCGPVLFYFIVMRTFQIKPMSAFVLSIPSALLVIWSFILLASPLGVTISQITYFSADSVISARLFYIFGFQVVIFLLLLFYDVFVHFFIWRKDHALIEKYRMLHTVALIVYLILGTADQSKIFVGWPLVVFRMFYSASFLFVYIVISRYESDRDSYLLMASARKVT